MIKWRGESLVGVFALAPCFSGDCILYKCWVVSERFVGVLVSFTLLALSLLHHCHKTRVYFFSVIWRLLHECYNFTNNVSMKTPFFYDVISSKFACGFFRLAILKFKLLTCNYNLRLGTIFDIDFRIERGRWG